ncbi:hypothetical protein SUGI_0816470 [Cryptomeria japonica]|nr:hypothetical protein SUGI_0816470 [Cryptomeria japonica]
MLLPRCGCKLDLYAVEKQLYLGYLDEVDYVFDDYVEEGKFDIKLSLCPYNGKKEDPIRTNRTFPCFGNGCTMHESVPSVPQLTRNSA